jgi:hypothetical protein
VRRHDIRQVPFRDSIDNNPKHAYGFEDDKLVNKEDSRKKGHERREHGEHNIYNKAGAGYGI